MRCRRRIPDLHQQLTSSARIGGEDLRSTGVHLVVRQRADPVRSARMREAEHGEHNGQRNRSSECKHAKHNAQADGNHPPRSSHSAVLRRRCVEAGCYEGHEVLETHEVVRCACHDKATVPRSNRKQHLPILRQRPEFIRDLELERITARSRRGHRIGNAAGEQLCLLRCVVVHVLGLVE